MAEPTPLRKRGDAFLLDEAQTNAVASVLAFEDRDHREWSDEKKMAETIKHRLAADVLGLDLPKDGLKVVRDLHGNLLALRVWVSVKLVEKGLPSGD